MDDGGLPCGSASPAYLYRACDIAFVYDSTITGRGWDSVVRAGAYDWCYVNDPYTGTSDFCWEDYTYNGGLPTVGIYGNYGVNVTAADLGGYNSQGFIILGEEGYSYTNALYAGNDFYGLVHGYVEISTDSAISWYVNSSQGSYTVPSGYIDMQTTVTHELGHGLGLNHPVQTDTGPGTPVMGCVENSGIYNHGSSYDFNGMRYIYDSYNSAWGTPVTPPC